MQGMLASLLAVVLAAPGAAPPALAPPGEEVVEEIVAVLRNPPGAAPRVVSLTRLTDEARIALVSRGAAEAAFQPIDGQALGATLVWLIDQTLLADDAARLRVAEVDREGAASELTRFRARFPDPATYARFLATTELSEEEVAAALVRTLRVELYLETRIGRGAAVTDEEVQAYVRDHGLVATTRAAREVVRARIAQGRVDAQARALVAELRSRADVRVLDAALAAPAGEGG
jgi:hypothetical protein